MDNRKRDKTHWVRTMSFGRLFANLENLSVEIMTSNGAVYYGLLDSFKEKVVHLTNAYCYHREEFQALKEADIEISMIQCLVSSAFPIVPKRKGGKGFTDNEIGLHKKKERELVKFTVDQNIQDSLEDDKGAKWDQFKVNEEKFGVSTTYEESLYTTKLDKTSKEYKDREVEAERLAREIEGKKSSNTHLNEERGQAGEEIDEETKYSFVIREEKKGDKAPKTFANIVKKQDQLDASLSAFKQAEKRKLLSRKTESKQQLIEFSKTFKLKTPMPEDIKELLQPKEPKVEKKETTEEWHWDPDAPEFMPDEEYQEVVQADPKDRKVSYKDLMGDGQQYEGQAWQNEQGYQAGYYVPQGYEDYYYQQGYYYDPNYYGPQYQPEATEANAQQDRKHEKKQEKPREDRKKK